MEKEKTYKVTLRCIVCGSTDQFEYNEDQSYIKCTNCGKEYFGGRDELVSYNQDQIEEIKEIATEEVINDLQKELNKIFGKL